MNSQKTKSNQYSMVKGKAVAGIVLLPENGQFRMYVAWEWEDQAMEGNFAIVKSDDLIDKSNMAEAINNVCDYGTDVTHKKEVRELFTELF